METRTFGTFLRCCSCACWLGWNCGGRWRLLASALRCLRLCRAVVLPVTPVQPHWYLIRLYKCNWGYNLACSHTESHDAFFFSFSGVTFPAKPRLNYSRTITLEGLSSVSKSETQRRCCRHCWWSRKDTLCSIYILDVAHFFSFSWSSPQPQVGSSEYGDSPWGFRRWRTSSQIPQGGHCIETSLPSCYNKCRKPFLC